MTKYKLTILALKILGHTAMTALDFTDYFFSTSKIASKNSLRAWYQRRDERHAIVEKTLEIIRDRKQLHNLIYRLQKDGLIKKDKNRLLSLTQIGTKHLNRLNIKLLHKLPDNKNYTIENDGVLKIVIFDIPEKEKMKRWWLVDTLRKLDYKLLQKSVWIGKNKLPSQLIKDLKKLGILSCVKIFSVFNEGNIYKV